MKLMTLLQHYDYQSTGVIVMVHSLSAADSNLNSNTTSMIGDFITKVEQQESVIDMLESLRKEVTLLLTATYINSLHE